jgi:hypothetical protein
MELSGLLGVLEYEQSPHFLTGEALRLDRDFGHLYRKAEQGCSPQWSCFRVARQSLRTPGMLRKRQ